MTHPERIAALETERVTAVEAKARGYHWAQFGWNHACGTPLMVSVTMVGQFTFDGKFSVKDLERWHRYMYPLPVEPAGDIPMERA